MAKKAATSSNPEIAAFRRELGKRKAELAEAAKKEASSGFLTDEEIIETLGLGEERKQFLTNLSRVRFGLDKYKSPYFAFNYTINQGEGKGTTVSQFFGLGGKTKADRIKKDERVTANFQRLNVDTTKFKGDVIDALIESANKLTLEKPSVRLALYTWGDEGDRLGVDIIGIADSSEDEKAELKDEAEEDQYEDADASEEEEEEGEDYESWVGYEGTYDAGDGAMTVTLTAWDADTGVFTVEDEAGAEYDAAPEDIEFEEE